MKNVNVEVVHMRNYGKTSKRIDGGVYVYCGRPSKLGNPYNRWNNGTREQNIEACKNDKQWNVVLDEFVNWVKEQEPAELKLGCFCAPLACHCDIIKAAIDEN